MGLDDNMLSENEGVRCQDLATRPPDTRNLKPETYLRG